MIYIIFLLIFFVIIFLVFSFMRENKNMFIESFYTNGNKETIILLGDSILKNNSYVENGEAVDSLLTKKVIQKFFLCGRWIEYYRCL